jgi:subtilisin family serine protease
MDLKSKEEQIRRLQQLRAQGDGPRRIRAWIDEAASRGVRLIPFPGGPTAGRLSFFVEMLESEANRMRHELTIAQVELLPGWNIPQTVTLSTTKKPRRVSGPAPRDLWHLQAIGLTAARRKGFKGTGKGVRVADLGTGMDGTSPELRGKIEAAVEIDSRTGTARPLARSVDTMGGYGTHHAGLVCGTNVGVAPDARLLDVVTFPRGQGTVTDLLFALDWVARQPEVQVVLIAAGFSDVFPVMDGVINSLVEIGILPVVAVGNDGRDRTRWPGNDYNALSVGALTRDLKVASFSSSGTLVAGQHIYHVPNVVAPGENVVSCNAGGGYYALTGTSSAAAIVAGLAALILEGHPQLTVAELKEAICSTGKILDDPPESQGHGLVRVKAALWN